MSDASPTFENDEHRAYVLEFEEFADGTITGRANMDTWRDYFDGKQLTEKELKALKRRGQPPIVDNKIRDKVETMLGIEKQQRTDPKAYPRTPQDESAAEVATDTLRYIADSCHYQQKVRRPAAQNLIVEGICAGQVIIEKRKGREPQISMENIRRDRVFYDIKSLIDDFSDANYKGYFTWMDYDDAVDMWPAKKESLEQCFSGGGENVSGPDKSLDDKPRFAITARQRRRVQVFTHYRKKKGKWNFATWCRGGFLDEPKVSAYKNEDGEPDCCIEIQALYRDADGNAYGTVQRYIDLQDAHNKRHSKMLHLLTTKTLIAENGAFADINKARDELHKPDGVLEPNKGFEYEVITNLDMAQGQFQLLQYTDAQLAQTGPNAALSGVSGQISGVAKARDQQAGQLTIAPTFDALDYWENRMYRHAWCRARQYWKGVMFIRVTDDEDKVQFVGLNQPVMVAEHLVEKAKSDPEFQQLPPEEQQGVIQEIAQRPEAQQMMKKNEVAQMDMDIIIERGEDTVNVQQEEFAMLMDAAKGRPEVPFDILVELSQMRSETKKRVVDRLKGANDPAAKMEAQFKQMMQQLEAALAKANVEKTAAQAEQAKAAATESHIDAAIKTAEFTSPAPEGENGKPGAKPAAKTTVSVN